MHRGNPEIVTIAQISLGSFWDNPKLKDEVFRPDIDEMIVLATNKAGTLATKQEAQVTPVDRLADQDQPWAEVIDLPVVELDSPDGVVIDFRPRTRSPERQAAVRRHPAIASMEQPDQSA